MHNLQNIDLDIPRDRFVVITGPSGSGKSSLAFDTLYAEGQRQYIESLSTYARQFLHQLERPDVDLIEGLQPTISIDQRAGSHNPRSTVATVTEIYDYLRLLFARLGEPRCYKCGEPIRQQTPEQILDALDGTQRRHAGDDPRALGPRSKGRAQGRARHDSQGRVPAGSRRRPDDRRGRSAGPGGPKNAQHRGGDRPRGGPRRGARANRRVGQSGDSARRRSGAGRARGEDRRRQRVARSAFQHAVRLPQLQDQLRRVGAADVQFQQSLWGVSGVRGAWLADGVRSRVGFARLRAFAGRRRIGAVEGRNAGRTAKAPESPAPVSCEGRHPLEHAAGDDFAEASRATLARRGQAVRRHPGMLEKEYATTASESKRQRLEAFRGEVVCKECGGARLRPEARSVRIAGRAIHEVTALDRRRGPAVLRGLGTSVPSTESKRGGEGERETGTRTVRMSRVHLLVSHISPSPPSPRLRPFPDHQQPIAQPILAEIATRLDFLDRVGLGYLTLDRPAGTLSGGELQRVRLAAGLGSGLVGVCYVLDEPSIGLHPRDNQRLIDTLSELQSRGNTIVVVEHDETIMRRADWLVDLGPGAGRHGGRVVALGTPEQIAANPESLTGRYLAGVERIPVPERRRRVAKTRAITIEGVTTNNLKNIAVQFPLSAMVCVTGVSGSGKSSLLDETLARALVRRLGGIAPKPGPHASLRGASQIDKVVQIDQSPIGRTPRSNPATYTGVFDEIRKVFANTRDAKQRGYKAGRFSFNVKGGRCEECQGQGQRRIEMNFLPDLYVACPVCEGKRFNRQTLDIRYRDRSIADVLDMQVEEAAEFFENFPAISGSCAACKRSGWAT